jgi:His-Xaa-Ser system radical SAM maturase HxsB
MKIKSDWAILPYNAGRIDGQYLVSNLFGAWDFLNEEEYKRLNQFNIKPDSFLFSRLLEKGLILKKENLPLLITDFRNLNSHLFTDTALHIAVVTTKCNLRCRYCQTYTQKPEDMNFKVAQGVLNYLLGVRNPSITLEFQGGEPLLNWKVVKFLIEYLRKLKTYKDVLCITIVTNGLLLDTAKIDFLVKYNVGISISLDGPAGIHNKNRIFSKNQGSYDKAKNAIKALRMAYKQKGIIRSIDLLPTITKHSLSFPEEIIDEYVEAGADRIALRPINRIGFAQCAWERVGFLPEEFNDFWAKAMDYIIKLNKKGTKFKERMAEVMLRKIFKKEYPGYVDLISPCGAGRNVLTYMPNGDIYPCDEARMSGSDIFKLGNVLHNKYEEVMKSSNLFSVCQASLMDFWDYNSPYLPWIGTCPVLNYICQGNLIPKITATALYKIYYFQFEYLFKKIAQDKKNEEIFRQWIE